jgi:hypothetical protein
VPTKQKYALEKRKDVLRKQNGGLEKQKSEIINLVSTSHDNAHHKILASNLSVNY